MQEDIKKYMMKRPVAARKGTIQYRAKKFIQRNSLRIGVTLLLSVVMTGATFYHLKQLRYEHDLAKAEAEKVSQIKNLMIDIFSVNNPRASVFAGVDLTVRDRKSTRLNSSHVAISYAVFCLKKKKNNTV